MSGQRMISSVRWGMNFEMDSMGDKGLLHFNARVLRSAVSGASE